MMISARQNPLTATPQAYARSPTGEPLLDLSG